MAPLPFPQVRAASLYYEAYRERSPEGIWNLGFMHEFGAGVPQDLALAKRFYDMAAHSYPDAALPVSIANGWLKAHRAVEWLRPRLPAAVMWLPLQLFTLRAAPGGPGGPGVAASAASATGGLAAGLMPPVLAMHWESLAGRVAGWLSSEALGPGGGGRGAAGDAGETALLLALVLALCVVQRVRRQRAEGRLREAQRGHPPAVTPAGGAAAAPLAAAAASGPGAPAPDQRAAAGGGSVGGPSSGAGGRGGGDAGNVDDR